MTHWDFLLKEAHWMAKDFGQVRARTCRRDLVHLALGVRLKGCVCVSLHTAGLVGLSGLRWHTWVASTHR